MLRVSFIVQAPMPRPLSRASIEQLEAAFRDHYDDPEHVETLLRELSHRTTTRAARLRERARERFAELTARGEPPPSPNAQTKPPDVASAPVPEARERETDAKRAARPTGIEYPPVTNTPESVLSAWIALEVLSPASFKKPEDLVPDSRDIVDLTHELPWERGAKSRPNCRLYYQVILGVVNLEPAVARLVERYADTRPDPPSARGRKAALAAVTVDSAGRLVDSSSIAISSFAWGVMAALDGELAGLARWPSAERELVEAFEERLRSLAATDEETTQRPLTRDDLFRIYESLVRELRLPPEFVEPPTFAIRSYVWYKDPNPPEPLILNSFFLGDLALARHLVANDHAPEPLARYLGSIRPTARVDLLEDQDELRSILDPENTPPGRWPAKDRASLVLLQQAAVNATLSRLPTGRIIGVNGPPGTGKTTLLRDIVAGVVVERAAAMVRFSDPETAFSHSGERLRAGGAWLHLYSLDVALRGFELVVASSNNKAVENVSAELPALAAVAEDANLRYFKTVSDVVHERETWGLIAAVLGNAQNRARFRRTFWWDEEAGFNRYLAAATGMPQVIESRDAVTGAIETRTPRVITEEQPPTSKQQAAKQWAHARERFAHALDDLRRWQAHLEKLRQVATRLPQLDAAVAAAAEESAAAEEQRRVTETHTLEARRALATAKNDEVAAWRETATALGTLATSAKREEEVAGALLDEAHRGSSAADRTLADVKARLAEHTSRRPGLLLRLFRRPAATAWNEGAKLLRDAIAAAASTSARARSNLQTHEARALELAGFLHLARAAHAAATAAADSDAGDAAMVYRFVESLRDSVHSATRLQLEPLLGQCRVAGEALARALSYAETQSRELARAEEHVQVTERKASAALDERAKARSKLDEARSQGIMVPDEEFFACPREDVHRATAWYPPEAQRARDDVFIAAMQVHRAFVSAAAKPLRHNLGALMMVFTGGQLSTERKRSLLPDLWSSLFLVVPLVSTTFASVERMFGKLPIGSLGWLLVDEGGQAVPQAAVGALLRTRKAVIIGDPLQIEPVVTLPEQLTTALCRKLEVDPDVYAAPAASVQTLADEASSYTSEFQTKTGSRKVGVPLLVHRRCSEPMFGISNTIAYGHLMVLAKAPRPSSIRDALGPSAWIHVEGTPQEKWCPEEGEQVLRMLWRLEKQRIRPDLLAITPFVVVAHRLRQVVRESGVLDRLGIDVDSWSWTRDRIGTLHTVQGREAEAVFLVLGAPSPLQTGARNWAGGRPNLLNVAATRAKEALYVVGNRRLWREAGVFSELDRRMPSAPS